MRGQNVSTAVMQRREPTPEGTYGPRGFPKQLDYFPTPPWAVRAGCRFLQDELGEELEALEAWEPACGEGHMVAGLVDSFGCVHASDVRSYRPGQAVHDFLQPGRPPFRADWIFTNPPFKLAGAFVRRALEVARRGVVMFVRSSFTEGDERYREMFTPETRPAYVVTYCERVVLLRDRLIQANALDPFNLVDGQPQRASSATSYALLVWIKGENDTRHRWIEPCRPECERDGDYPAYLEQWEYLRSLKADSSQPELFA
jgi:hypothetical protein